MVIRVAAQADCEVLCGLVLGFRDHLGLPTPSADDLRAFLPGALADDAIEFCVAVESGSAVGYSQCRFFRSIWSLGFEAHLEDLFVVADRRGQGLGEDLLQFAFDRAHARHAIAMGLSTNENNHDAHRLYRRLGFAPETEPIWDGGREIFWSKKLQ